MQIQTIETLRPFIALGAGGIIGVGFAAIQNLALRRNQQKQAAGKLNHGWAVMPGSMKRVTWLMIALVLVQIICPMLFIGSSQWYVSAGVALGYGAVLFQRFRRKTDGA